MNYDCYKIICGRPWRGVVVFNKLQHIQSFQRVFHKGIEFVAAFRKALNLDYKNRRKILQRTYHRGLTFGSAFAAMWFLLLFWIAHISQELFQSQLFTFSYFRTKRDRLKDLIRVHDAMTSMTVLWNFHHAMKKLDNLALLILDIISPCLLWALRYLLRDTNCWFSTVDLKFRNYTKFAMHASEDQI